MDIPNRRVASEPVLIKLLTNTKVLHVDVRPPEEFLAGRLPHSINIPIHELAKRLKELPKRKEVIAYCRGPYCLMSYDAVQERNESTANGKPVFLNGVRQGFRWCNRVGAANVRFERRHLPQWVAGQSVAKVHTGEQRN